MPSTSNTQAPVDNPFADERRTVQHAVPMPTFEHRVQTLTSSCPDFVDVTDDVADAVARSQIVHGRAIVFATDDSCSIMVNERETGLLEDIKRTIARLAPSNGHPVVGSASVVVPVGNGELQLGTWQRILLVELGQPCPRSIDVQIVGER